MNRHYANDCWSGESRKKGSCVASDCCELTCQAFDFVEHSDCPAGMAVKDGSCSGEACTSGDCCEVPSSSGHGMLPLAVEATAMRDDVHISTQGNGPARTRLVAHTTVTPSCSRC